MTVKRTGDALEKYREYNREYQRKYGRHYYKPDQKKKYRIFRNIAEVFRNILLD